ncbi:MAG: hypothetical protein HY652_08720 [Acidobacteria bacterium]|nr:hypothetical protein [Acidobacteriota bacterium]
METKLKELKRIRAELEQALRQCEGQIRQRHTRAECPVLVGIETEIHLTSRRRRGRVGKEAQE